MNERRSPRTRSSKRLVLTLYRSRSARFTVRAPLPGTARVNQTGCL